MKFHFCVENGPGRYHESACYAMIDEITDANGKSHYIWEAFGTDTRTSHIAEYVDYSTAEKLACLYAEVSTGEYKDGDWDVENDDDYAGWDAFSTEEVASRFLDAVEEAGFSREDFIG